MSDIDNSNAAEPKELDFDAGVLIQLARSLTPALIVGVSQGQEDLLLTQHRDDCMPIIADLQRAGAQKVENLGELDHALPCKKS